MSCCYRGTGPHGETRLAAHSIQYTLSLSKHSSGAGVHSAQILRKRHIRRQGASRLDMWNMACLHTACGADMGMRDMRIDETVRDSSFTRVCCLHDRGAATTQLQV